MTTEQIDSTELATLREKARLYDEAAGQEPILFAYNHDGQILTTRHQKTATKWNDDEAGDSFAVFAKPVPQSLDTAQPGVPDVDVVVVTVSLNGWSSVKHIPLLVVETSNIREVARFADQAWADVKSAMGSNS